MCGIAGIYSQNQIPNLQDRIRKMNSSIFHRGPDAGGEYINGNMVLGHRRLSIIDTDKRSDQPMHSNNKEWHIVFNGEIYNFKEIKEKLDYDFFTDSDTEVILAAVQEKGVNWFIEHSNGMFAIAMYNAISKDLYLIRDRLGIKPLFYYKDGSSWVFGSEIKAILCSDLVKTGFNESAVDEYLANRYIRAPFTFFDNIFQVSPGSYLHIKKDFSFEEKKYWDIPASFNISTRYSEKKILEEFEDELTTAIKYRLVSDVPLGTYLSGGVDSSLITAITSLNKSEKIKTYTIGFEGINEFDYSEMVAKKYDTDHHMILMKKEDYMDNWERLIKYKDAPLGVPNEIPLAVMSSKLKEKLTVVLSGEGADELLGGYGRIFRLPFDYSNATQEKTFYESFIDSYEYVPRVMRDGLISSPKDYRNKFDETIGLEFKHRTNEENIFNYFHSYHVKGLLQRVDMTTMQTSVEARVPFLDHNLIEFSYAKIPFDLKLKWRDEAARESAKKSNSKYYSEKLDIPKYLLRKLSYKYLPKEVVERKKVGFPVPLTTWFDNLESLARDFLGNCTWLKKGVLDDLIQRSKKENRAGQILWMFINVELFKNHYFNGEHRN